MDELEHKFEMPESFEHRAVVREGAHSTEYFAKVRRLHFDGIDSIRGGVYLHKEEKVTETVPVTRVKLRKSWWPFQMATTMVIRIRQRIVWKLQTEYDHEYFVFNGYLCDGQFPNIGYRREIRGLAANKGVILTDKLLDFVFGPVDGRIKQLLETARRLSLEKQRPDSLSNERSA